MKSFSDYTRLLRQGIDALDATSFDEAIQVIRKAWLQQRPIYVFGNGGSALAASQLVTDLNKTVYLRTGRPFHGHCLNDSLGLVTAYANDLSYADIFAEQLKPVLKEDDLVIAISGSGNSPNVLRAVELAKSRKAITLGLCGYDGGKLKELVDYAAHVPVNDMQICEDLHLSFIHSTMRVLVESVSDR